jgi:two-component system, LuxR family, sensor kinase FixL
MPSSRRVTRAPFAAPLPWAVVLGYFAVFLLLDWASFIRPLQNLNITPWNPQPALAVALLMASRRLWWVVWLSVMAAEVLVRGLPADLFVAAAAAAALSCSYLAIATALQSTLTDSRQVAGRRDVAWFTAISAAGSLLNGVVYVGAFVVGGVVEGRAFSEAVARYWVGDVVGLVVTLPVVLALMDAERRALLWQTLRHRHAWAIAVAVAALLWTLFRWMPPDDLGFTFLLLLPVIWAATLFGTVGALLASALTQAGMLLAVQAAQAKDLRVFELQVLMATVSMTGLLLGVVVDERLRANAELRRSLRLAAAGQMAAALSHELSQPLTALATYAQAFDLAARQDARVDVAQRQHQVADIVARMRVEALRAGEVVRRLRDFFRAGTTQLEPVDVAVLAREALDAQARRATAAKVDVRLEWPEATPVVWVDAVQIAVVLRNLVANALDALQQGHAGPRLMVRGSENHDELLVEVLDNGPGVVADRAGALFEPAASDKPGGMGVGLSICRAIVEAHGGRLWAEVGAGGHFCFTLPLDVQRPGVDDHAA